MATTLPTASANAAADAVVDLVDADASPGYIEVYDSGMTLLFTVTLAATAFGDAGASNPGEAIAAGLPIDSAAAVASGTADSFKCLDGAGTEVFGGDVGGTLEATSGDLQLNTSTIVTDDVVQITSFTYTAPTS